MPNQYDRIGEGLSGLGEFLKGLSQLNDKDKSKRDRVAKNLADDPDLVQKYKGLSDESLHAILGDKAKFGKDKVAEIIAQIRGTPDSPSLKTQKIKEAAIQAVTGQQDSMKKVGVPFSGVDATNLPTVTRDQQNIYNQSVGLPTVEQANLTKTQQEHADINVKIGNENLNRITETEQAAKAAREYLTKHKLDPWKAYKDIANLPPEVARGLTSDPDLQHGVQTGMANEHYVKTEEMQRLAMSSKYNLDNLMMQGQVQSAQDISKRLGVPMQAVYDLQTDPVKRQTYGAEGYVPKSPQEEAYVTAAKGLNELAGKYTQTQINQAKARYAAEVDKIQKLVDTGKYQDPNQAPAELNRLGATILGSLGIDAPQYSFGPEGDNRKVSGAPFHDNERFPFTKSPKLYISNPGDPRLGYTLGGTVSGESEGEGGDNSQAKADYYEKVKKMHPKMSTAAITAIVNAKYNKK